MHLALSTLLVGAGGFAGAASRWGLGTWIKNSLGNPSFPYPTLIINLLGCFAIGVAYAVWEENPVLRLLVVVGFLGGFTTFSAFGLETLHLLQRSHTGTAALYVGLSATLGVLLVWSGLKIAS